MMFPVWLLKFLVYGGLLLCSAGVLALLAFLVIDLKRKNIW